MKDKYLRVDKEEHMYRDTDTNAIINVNDIAYEQHKKTKEFLKRKHLEEKQKEARLNNLEKEVASLKEGIGQILDILRNDR
jgi:hypothetical protein